MEIHLPFGYIMRMPTPDVQEPASSIYPALLIPATPPAEDSFTASPTPPVRDSFTASPLLTADEVEALFDELESCVKTPRYSPNAALGESPSLRTNASSSEVPFDTISPQAMHINPFQLDKLAYDPFAHEAEAVDLPEGVETPVENASDIESAPESDKAESPATAKAPGKKRSNRKGLVDERIAVINDYKNGEKNRAKLAEKHGVKPDTIDSWVRRFRKNANTPFFKTDAELQEADKADRKALKEQPAPDAPKSESSHKRKRSSEEGGGLDIAVPSPKRPTALKHVLGVNWEDWVAGEHV